MLHKWYQQRRKHTLHERRELQVSIDSPNSDAPTNSTENSEKTKDPYENLIASLKDIEERVDVAEENGVALGVTELLDQAFTFGHEYIDKTLMYLKRMLRYRDEIVYSNPAATHYTDVEQVRNAKDNMDIIAAEQAITTPEEQAMIDKLNELSSIQGLLRIALDLGITNEAAVTKYLQQKGLYTEKPELLEQEAPVLPEEEAMPIEDASGEEPQDEHKEVGDAQKAENEDEPVHKKANAEMQEQKVKPTTPFPEVQDVLETEMGGEDFIEPPDASASIASVDIGTQEPIVGFTPEESAVTQSATVEVEINGKTVTLESYITVPLDYIDGDKREIAREAIANVNQRIANMQEAIANRGELFPEPEPAPKIEPVPIENNRPATRVHLPQFTELNKSKDYNTLQRLASACIAHLEGKDKESINKQSLTKLNNEIIRITSSNTNINEATINAWLRSTQGLHRTNSEITIPTTNQTSVLSDTREYPTLNLNAAALQKAIQEEGDTKTLVTELKNEVGNIESTYDMNADDIYDYLEEEYYIYRSDLGLPERPVPQVRPNASHENMVKKEREKQLTLEIAAEKRFNKLLGNITDRMHLEITHLNNECDAYKKLGTLDWALGGGTEMPKNIQMHARNAKKYAELRSALVKRWANYKTAQQKEILLTAFESNYKQLTTEQGLEYKEVQKRLEVADKMFEFAEQAVEGVDWAAEQIAGKVVPKGDFVYKIVSLSTKFLTGQIENQDDFAIAIGAEVINLAIPETIGSALLNYGPGRKITAGILQILKNNNIRTNGKNLVKVIKGIATFLTKEGTEHIQNAYAEHKGSTDKNAPEQA